MKTYKVLFILCLLLITIENNWSQTYKFKNYGIEQGICHSVVYAINQDKNGFVWIGTGEGLCRYDGFGFTSLGTDSLIEGVVSSMFKDHQGILWIGYNNGAILKYNGTSFELLDTKEKLTSSVVGFVEYKDKGLLAATQNNGLVIINDKGELKQINEGLENIFISAINIMPDGKILLGTFNGLLLINQLTGNQPVNILNHFKELEYIKIQAIYQQESTGTIYLGTEDAGLYSMVSEGESLKISSLGERFGMEYENIQHIYEDKDTNLWLSTFGSGIYRMIYDTDEKTYSEIINYNNANGLGSQYIKAVYEDGQGNYWAGTYGNGLSCLTSEAFVFYELNEQPIEDNILSLYSQGKIDWYGSTNGLLKHEKGIEPKYSFYSVKDGLPDDEISALYQNKEKLWIGSKNSGLYLMDINNNRIKRYPLADNSLGNKINHINGHGDTIWVATQNGVYVLMGKNGEIKNFSTNDGLPHNNIIQVYLDKAGDAWLAAKSNGICVIEDARRINFMFTEGLQEIDFTSITEDQRGNLWAATSGVGVLRFNKDTLLNISTMEGLKSSYCYSIVNDKNDHIWVGHRLGMSRIDTRNFSVKTYGTDMGITGDCNYNAISESDEGTLKFGTTDGILAYNPDKEEDKMDPPVLNITSLRIADKEYDFTEPIVLPYDVYKLRVEFIGLDYKSPEFVKYQYLLEGFDVEWSELTASRYASYGRIADGEYTFKLKACNADGICNQKPLSIKLKIKLPFWKTWWFISLSVVVLIITVYLIIKIRERKQKELQEFLQRSLDERTKEVVKQKEEIEIKNKDITDSINYAQRIQASILPSMKKLQTRFSGSFIFYQPRDIVSGDFYWFDEIKNDKFVIVCADSTGHGVPGAFMSMIGTTLIKDICARKDVTKPSEILVSLDNELTNTLNQNIEAERSNDGMDIIVCEIDLKTYYVRLASAMRPVIIYQNGQQLYVKGSRNSIGGHINKEQKEFVNEGFQLSKGDQIYMFSDGYPDQFGGPMEKKFKMVRLKNLLKDINKKPMEEQFQYVKSTFNLWKEDLEQVDDVLFMGIRI